MPDCPTPGRVPHRTEGEAWAALRNTTPDTRRDHLGLRMLPYRCGCGRWHVALAAEARAKREAGRA
jgi:hypothetical protein